MLKNNTNDIEHIPVLLNEVLEYLAPQKGMVVVDATIGSAGHAEAFLERIFPQGRLIGIDRDEETLKIAENKLARFRGSFNLFHANFTDLDIILKEMNIKKIDLIFFDLGLSSYQLLNPERGFSFRYDGPLDMRMDRRQPLTAYDIVNFYSKEELASLIKKYGEERKAYTIANLIVKERRKEAITSTRRLCDIIASAFPPAALRARRHPATRTFQALRIAVNNELEHLEIALQKAINHLIPGGKIGVISFHSLEDRIVKNIFRNYKKKNKLELLTTHPITPTASERELNPRSRSAKFRVAKRINNNFHKKFLSWR